HNAVASSNAQLIGSRYFKQEVITWSIRKRGSVHRTHIMTKTISDALVRKFSSPKSLATNKSSPPHIEKTGIGPFQPPRNRITKIPLTANIEAYSARKKNDQRMPLYSVRNPATSSLSASARSKGARLQLATAQVK